MKILTITLLLLLPSLAIAAAPYQTTDDFLADTFEGNTPNSSTLWIGKDKKIVIEQILQHKAHFIRVRYWQKGLTTAWVLEEIGKEKPITVGVVIHNKKIQRLKVLAFRESRGSEVRHHFFTQQFEHTGLNSNRDDYQLDKSIDGISGATLSVRALKKIARIALYLEADTSL